MVGTLNFFLSDYGDKRHEWYLVRKGEVCHQSPSYASLAVALAC